MPKAATKSITEIVYPKGMARGAQAEQAILARAFFELDTPIYQLRYAALLAEHAAEAIGESNDDIEMATLTVRHVAQLAQQLEDLWHASHAESCDAGRLAAA
jgi:hypothetical protein